MIVGQCIYITEARVPPWWRWIWAPTWHHLQLYIPLPPPPLPAATAEITITIGVKYIVQIQIYTNFLGPLLRSSLSAHWAQTCYRYRYLNSQRHQSKSQKLERLPNTWRLCLPPTPLELPERMGNIWWADLMCLSLSVFPFSEYRVIVNCMCIVILSYQLWWKLFYLVARFFHLF